LEKGDWGGHGPKTGRSAVKEEDKGHPNFKRKLSRPSISLIIWDIKYAEKQFYVRAKLFAHKKETFFKNI
jgi:hypothetical protein